MLCIQQQNSTHLAGKSDLCGRGGSLQQFAEDFAGALYNGLRINFVEACRQARELSGESGFLGVFNES